MTQSEQPSTSIPNAFIQLAREFPANNVMWSYNHVPYIGEEMVQHLTDNTEVGVKYVQLLVHEGLAGLTKKDTAIVPAPQDIDVTVRVGTTFAEHFAKMPPASEVWRTMSGIYLAGEMPALIEQRDEGIMTLISDVLRIVRDQNARKTVRLHNKSHAKKSR